MSSDENKNQSKSDTPKKPDGDLNNVSDIFEPLDEQAVESTESQESPESQLEKTKSEFLYLRAEFENYKRNAIKDRVSLQKYGAQRLALDLLPALDVLNQALSEVDGKKKDDDPFVQGIKMTQKELNQSLEKHGIKEVLSLGQAFNPEFHEALGTEPTNDYKEGEVCRVFKAPYKYHEKLLRAGQVFVAIPLPEKA